MSDNKQDLDPLDALDDPTAEDPSPEEITDKNHQDYVKPAANIKPRKKA